MMVDQVQSALGVSQGDLTAFHAAHFSTTSTKFFATHFLGPVDEEEEEYYEEEDDDGLGYYDDGEKRTLTDEQIAIFRHSEIEALLRERRHVKEAKDAGEISSPAVEEGELGELDAVKEEGSKSEPAASRSLLADKEPSSTQTSKNRNQNPNKNQSQSQNQNKKVKKAQKAREKGWFKATIKPDLRKRTWDKVDSGMDSLDYGEESSAAPRSNPAAQRRRISYDD